MSNPKQPASNPSERDVEIHRVSDKKRFFHINDLRTLEVQPDEGVKNIYLVVVNGMYTSPFDYNNNTKEFSLVEHDTVEELKRAIKKDEISREITTLTDKLVELEKNNRKKTKWMKELEQEIEEKGQELNSIEDLVWVKIPYNIVICKDVGGDVVMLNHVVSSYIKNFSI